MMNQSRPNNKSDIRGDTRKSLLFAENRRTYSDNESRRISEGVKSHRGGFSERRSLLFDASLPYL